MSGAQTLPLPLPLPQGGGAKIKGGRPKAPATSERKQEAIEERPNGDTAGDVFKSF